MMIIEAPVLTDNGWTYVTRAVGGEQMVFTRYKVGNGDLTPADGDGHALNNLKNPLLSFGITEINTERRGAAEIIGSFSSADITPPGFYAKEVGLFASMGAAVSMIGDGTTKTFNLNPVIEAVSKVTVDNVPKEYTFDAANHRITFTTAPANGTVIEVVYPVGEEILYAYSNDGEMAGFIGPADDVVAVQTVDLVVAIGDAEHVTAILTDSAVYAKKTELEDHKNAQNNPHHVTKEDVGLGNVDNVSNADIALTYTTPSAITNLVSGEKLPVTLGKIRRAIMDLISHISNKNNPHEVTTEKIGAAKLFHTHSVNDFIDGVLDVARGGTGAGTPTAARENLGIADAIIEQGAKTISETAEIQSGKLKYDKYASGNVHIYGYVKPKEVTISGEYGTMYSVTLPTNLVGTAYAVQTTVDHSILSWEILSFVNGTDLRFYISKAKTNSSTSIFESENILVDIRGRWKGEG